MVPIVALFFFPILKNFIMLTLARILVMALATIGTVLIVFNIPLIHYVHRRQRAHRLNRSKIRGTDATTQYESLLELYATFTSIPELRDIPVVADWGTCLGLHRGGSLIEHDYDIDLTADEADFDVLITAVEKRFASEPDYDVTVGCMHPWIGCQRHLTITHKPTGVHVDLDPRVVKHGRVYRGHLPGFFRSNLENIILPGPYRSHAYDEFFPLQPVGSLYLPHKPAELLEKYYGDWQTPVEY